MIYRKKVTIAVGDTTSQLALLTLGASAKAKLVALFVSSNDSAAAVLNIGTTADHIRINVPITGDRLLGYNPSGWFAWAAGTAIKAYVDATVTTGKTLEIIATFED